MVFINNLSAPKKVNFINFSFKFEKKKLAEQAKRMGGSKLDFLDGDDIGSITSSYSSINGPTLSRGNTGQVRLIPLFKLLYVLTKFTK